MWPFWEKNIFTNLSKAFYHYDPFVHIDHCDKCVPIGFLPKRPVPVYLFQRSCLRGMRPEREKKKEKTRFFLGALSFSISERTGSFFHPAMQLTPPAITVSLPQNKKSGIKTRKSLANFSSSSGLSSPSEPLHSGQELSPPSDLRSRRKWRKEEKGEKETSAIYSRKEIVRGRGGSLKVHCMDGEWKCVARGDSDARGKKRKGKNQALSLPPVTSAGGRNMAQKGEREKGSWTEK